jgi:hypothetical protein
VNALTQFPAKWEPVRRRKCDPTSIQGVFALQCEVNTP